MSTLMVRNIDPAVKEQLRVRAARHGRTMEAELRQIICDVVAREQESGASLSAAIRNRFAPVGGVEIKLPARAAGRDAPSFA